MATDVTSCLKLELVHTRSFRTREEAKLALFEYMEVFYNRRRRHSSPGYVSAAEYERKAEVQEAGSVANLSTEAGDDQGIARKDYGCSRERRAAAD